MNRASDNVGHFIAGDWGTSNLRLFLCRADGTMLESVSGPGAAAANGQFAHIFESLTRPWRQAYGELPGVLCGMVGSSFGWVEAPYVACPARPEQIAGAAVRACADRVHVIPGLSCRNQLNAPDFLRGEETQILGALRLDPNLRQGRHLLCLPGTHTKWAILLDGAVSEFITAVTGELFGLLRDHSVLVRSPPDVDVQTGDAAFQKGVSHFKEHPRAQLLHGIFQCRSRQLTGEYTAQESASFLSGLLIASDIAGMFHLMPDVFSAGKVVLIGSTQLTALYASGLASHGGMTRVLDGADASLAGIAQVHQMLEPRVVEHAGR